MSLPPPSEDGLDGLEPLPNRFTRATALGCLGILGVAVLPIFLVLPLTEWHLPRWGFQALELGAVLAMASGIGLLSRVPSTHVGDADPRHPLTRAGRAPLIEQPATTRNRTALLCILALSCCIIALYIVAGSFVGHPAFGILDAAIGALGVLTISLGACIALGRAPVPAWRWVRTSVSAPGMPQGLAGCLLGAIAVGWSLLAAAGAGYAWGIVGLSLFVLICVLLAPLARRWPSRLTWNRTSEAPSQQPPDLTT